MLKFSDWLKIRESSASTRLKRQAALGLAPPVADIFSHGTPPPWQVDRLKSALKKSHAKKKKKKKKKKKNMVSEASKPQPINKSMDSFIVAIEKLVKDLWELRRIKKEKGIKDSKQKSKDLIKKVAKSQVKVDKEKDKLDMDKLDIKDKKKIDDKKNKIKDMSRLVKKISKNKGVD